MTDELDVQAIATEAQETFDFDNFLNDKITLRERTVTVFLDEVTGEALGGSEETAGAFGLGGSTRRWGVIGKIKDLREQNTEGQHDDEILALTDEAEKLWAKLQESGLTITLRAVPPIILKDTRRRAKAALGIKGKDIPEDRNEEFIDRQQAELLADAYVSSKNAKGQVLPKEKFGADQAAKLRDRMSQFEYSKIDRALGELQYQAAIASSVTSAEDF